VSSSLKHLLGRFPRYELALSGEEASEFFAETEHTVRFLNKAILDLIRALHEDLRGLGVEIPEDAEEDATVGDELQRLNLPHNIDEADILDEEQRIAEVATKYLAANDRLSWAGTRRVEGARGLRDFVLANIDEERAHPIEVRHLHPVDGHRVQDTCLAPVARPRVDGAPSARNGDSPGSLL